MDHHAMIQVHHEEISPPQHPQLPDYPSKSTVTGWQPSAVGKAAMHGVSDVLASRYPYPSDTMYDALEPSIAYGRNGVPKTMMVLRQLVDLTSSGEAVDEEDLTRQKRANVAKLIEALCDHTVIGDALTADKLEGGTVLLKELLADSDVQVRTGAAAALGRLATLTQGRKAICESGCAEALAHLLEDAEGADVRLEAGRTLGALARSQDGVALVAGEGTDGRVVQRMVRALVAVCARKSALETPGLAPVLLDALGQLLRGDAAAELALGEQVVPLVVELLRRRRHNAETLQALVALAGHMPGKKALIEAGALQAICGLLASHMPAERQLAARAALLLAGAQDGKKKSNALIPHLVAQLYEEDHDMYMNALLALRSISEWPAARELVVKVLEDDPEMRSEVLRDHQVHLAAFRYQPDAPPRV